MNLIRFMRWSVGLLAVSALIEIITGLFLFFNFDSFGKFSLFQVHKYNGLIFIALVIVHFMTNWPWFKAQFFRRKPVNRLSSRGQNPPPSA